MKYQGTNLAREDVDRTGPLHMPKSDVSIHFPNVPARIRARDAARCTDLRFEIWTMDSRRLRKTTEELQSSSKTTSRCD